MTSLKYRYYRLIRKKKIKLGNQKERLSDLEKIWYYDPYYVDYALHRDKGKPWKVHKKRINPLEFPPLLNIVKNLQRYSRQILVALLLLFFAIFMNYGSQIIDWIVSYNVQLREMLDERERAEAARRELLLSLTAEGFEQNMDSEVSDDIDQDLYDKADHLTMDELELSYNTTAPLTSSEVLSADDIKNILSKTWIYNNSLSDEEYRIAKSALLTVGRIPYVLGGAQPTRPSNTERDESGFPIVPDNAIVSFANQISGMDCSHWVDWIYYIAVNNNLGYCNTDSMIYTQGNGSLKLVAVDESGDEYDQGLSNIRAGDIMVYGHDGSHRFGHAAIFLGYVSRGGSDARDMMYVHESSTAGNVSFHVGEIFGNNGSSPVFYYRYKSLPGESIDYDYEYLRQLQAGADEAGNEDDEEEVEDDVDFNDEDEEAEEDDDEVDDEEDDEDDDSDSAAMTDDDDEDDDDEDDDDEDEDDEDDDDDDEDDYDKESYKRYVEDEEAESFEPVNPENPEVALGDDVIQAP